MKTWKDLVLNEQGGGVIKRKRSKKTAMLNRHRNRTNKTSVNHSKKSRSRSRSRSGSRLGSRSRSKKRVVRKSNNNNNNNRFLKNSNRTLNFNNVTNNDFY